MKCTICGKKILEDEEICQACRDGLSAKGEDLEAIISRHKEWAIERLGFVDLTLKQKKERTFQLEKSIQELEGKKWLLLLELGRLDEYSGGKK